MGNRKIDQLPNFTGDTTGVHVVINNASNTTTHTVTKEVFLDGNNTFHGNQVVSGSLSVSGTTEFGGNLVPRTARGATLGTLERPFREIFLQSGSISIESDIIGDPNTVISNIGGNLLVSAGGMRLIDPASFVAATGSFSYLSGSFTHLGSANRTGDTVMVGNTITTGSLRVSGSTAQIGDNSLIGNTTLSGSIEIDGDAHHTGSMNILGNTYHIGQTNHTGSVNITGSLYIQSGSGFPQSTGSSLVTYNQTTGQLAHANFASVLPSLVNYGAFSDLTTQSGSADTAYAMKLNTTDIASGFSIVSGSRITAANAGTYNLQFSAQLLQTSNNAPEISIWLRKDGTNVPNSNTELTIEKVSGGGKLVAAWNFIVQLNANQYVELMWSSTRSDTQLHFHDVESTPTRPATPSVIVTMTQIV